MKRVNRLSDTLIAGTLLAFGLVVALYSFQYSRIGSGFIGLGRFLSWVQSIHGVMGIAVWLVIWFAALVALTSLLRIIRWLIQAFRGTT